MCKGGVRGVLGVNLTALRTMRVRIAKQANRTNRATENSRLLVPTLNSPEPSIPFQITANSQGSPRPRNTFTELDPGRQMVGL